MTSGEITNLSARAAQATMRHLEGLAPAVGEPLDHVDCALLGLWRRLDAGDRTVPNEALELLERRPDRASAAALRDRQPELWLAEPDVSDLLAGILLLRLRGFTGSSVGEVDELVGEGLTLALLIPRVYYAGNDLRDFMARARSASRAISR